MKDLKEAKEKVWERDFKTFHRCKDLFSYEYGFDAGVKAERERIQNILFYDIMRSDKDFTLGEIVEKLFPEKEGEENEKDSLE